MKIKFELMLFGLAVILRKAQSNLEPRLRTRTRTVQIRTADGSTARYFVFCGGTFFSRRGLLTDPDVSLVWKDASVATRALRSSDPDAQQTALANEWLTIVGDGEVANWFGDLVRASRSARQRPHEALPSVSVLGLGRMGSGIAHSLLRSGFPVVVYNRTEAKMRPLLEAGAKAAASPAAAARASKYVITSLMSDESVFAVVEGQDGLLAGLGLGAIHIGASTISAEASRRLANLHAVHGSEYLAAPVLGRPEAANAGQLVTLVCGKRSVFDESRTVLQGYTRQVQYLAEDHAVASAAKLAVNYAAVTVIDLMGQIYAYGEKANVPLSSLHMVFRMMWAQPVLQDYATRMLHREFNEIGLDLLGGLKDVTLMLNGAKEQGVRWDFAEAIQRKMIDGIEMGLGQKDWSSTYVVTRAEAGLIT